MYQFMRYYFYFQHQESLENYNFLEILPLTMDLLPFENPLRLEQLRRSKAGSQHHAERLQIHNVASQIWRTKGY